MECNTVHVFRCTTWRSSPSSLVLVPPGPFFGFHLRFCGLILCGLRVWNKEMSNTEVSKEGERSWKFRKKKLRFRRRAGWKQHQSPGENDISHLLSSTEFDGSLKRAAESPWSEINGLKLKRDMKPAAAYKNTWLTWRGGVCIDTLSLEFWSIWLWSQRSRVSLVSIFRLVALFLLFLLYSIWNNNKYDPCHRTKSQRFLNKADLQFNFSNSTKESENSNDVRKLRLIYLSFWKRSSHYNSKPKLKFD